ncbi:MAG TPA: endonuclease/exonuclease/phosphatase family protein [Gemmataceae bacterium]|nr:endonuclease/exonuclease/phosphatase family protein [Gemmataceae bacterium]
MIAKFIRICAVLLFCLAGTGMQSGCNHKVDGSGTAVQPGEFLFCHWNVENFFDDKADKRSKTDMEYDSWFANNKQALELKLDKLTEALLKMNNGRGPDILCVCEVESVRAAELLKDALNKKVDAGSQYQNVLMKEVSAGRHIAPAIITRLPVLPNKTRLLEKTMRVLEGHLVVNGKELTIFASHWTSRIQATGEQGREKYADAIYREYVKLHAADPKAAVIVCGDFNDTPQDVSVVKHLHGSSNSGDVQQNRADPLLFNLFGDKDAKGFGTHFYNSKWFIFDQILVSPAMLSDGGWTCDVASAQTFNSLHKPTDAQKRPWRFGNENEKGARGYSDHFPVIVKLRAN